MKLSERDRAFFQPVWRRVLLIAVVALWAAWEILYTKDGFWTVLALGFLAYSVWAFVITWKPAGDGSPE